MTTRKAEPIRQAPDEDAQLSQAFEALRAIQGIAKGKKANISGQIDEILYGKNGVWKGHDE